jgi:general secretion pathway protein H
MIVIVVMGLMLTLVLGRGPSHSPTLALQAATSRVAQALRLARTDAIAHGRPVSFRLDAVQSVFGPPGHVEAMAPGIAMAATRPFIVFEPDGSATSGVIGLSLRAMRTEITVHWVNGRVSVGQAQTG